MGNWLVSGWKVISKQLAPFRVIREPGTRHARRQQAISLSTSRELDVFESLAKVEEARSWLEKTLNNFHAE